MSTYKILESRRILPNTEVTPHQFLFSWNDKPCFARGELVALTGKAKSGKTYLCSLLMALAIRQQIMGIQRIQDDPLKVLWIDTEQSADSTHEILSLRMTQLLGQAVPNEQYFVYNFRQDNWQERLSLVIACINQHNPDLVIFDGIRDVVGDINNYQEAQNVLGKLLSLASVSNACIVCVLHQNKSLEDKTLRGALGTELQNKSFETYECHKDPDTRIFSMRQTATRKYDISTKLEWTVNDEGLPVTEESKLESEETKSLNATDVFTTILAGKELRARELRAQIKSHFQISNDETFKRLFAIAQSEGLIVRRQVSEREVYYSLASSKINENPELF